MTQGPKKALFVCEKVFEDQLPILMRALRRRHDTKFVLIAASAARATAMQDWCEDGDRIIVSTDIDAEAEKQRAQGIGLQQRARQLEEDFELTIMRDVVMQDRSYAGSALGYAEYDVHSSAMRRDYDQILGSIVYFFDYWEELIKNEGIDFVFAKTGGLSATALVHQAMKHKIPTSILLHSRFKTLYTWSSDGYLGNSLIHEEWKTIDPNIELLPKPERPIAEISEKNMAAVKEWRSTKRLLKNFATATWNRIVWRTRDIRRRRWSKRLPYIAVLRKHLSTWLMFRRLDALVERDVDKITEKPFVLFLLSLEPEYTTLTLAKEFNNTEATVRQLALSLPAGYNLVVKEHVTNIGNRGIEFYSRLLRLPNVILADYQLHGVALAAEAEAVSAVSGTIGIEASMLGKDVIGFSDRTEYAFLDNQHMVRSFFNLPEVVRTACRKKTQEEFEKTRRDVARFRQAIENLSYDLPEGYEMGGSGQLTDEQADRAVAILERVIAHQLDRHSRDERFHHSVERHLSRVT